VAEVTRAPVFAKSGVPGSDGRGAVAGLLTSVGRPSQQNPVRGKECLFCCAILANYEDQSENSQTALEAFAGPL